MKNTDKNACFRLTKQCGKATFETDLITRKVTEEGDIDPNGSERILYIFSQDEVKSLDATRFMETFGPLATKHRSSMRNNVIFMFTMYDDDPRELCEIPEVRAFVRHLHLVWPCWLFYMSGDAPHILQLLCCLWSQDIVIHQSRVSDQVVMIIPEMQVVGFLQEPAHLMPYLERTIGTGTEEFIERLDVAMLPILKQLRAS